MVTSTTPATASGATDGQTSGDSGATDWETDFRWIIAWMVLLLILWAVSRARIGAVVIYYALALMLLFLIVTQFKFIAGALVPFGNLGPGLSTGNDTPPPADTQSQGGSQ